MNEDLKRANEQQESLQAEYDSINRRVNELFDYPQDRRLVRDRRSMPRGTRDYDGKWTACKPDWTAVALWVCVGLLCLSVGGYLL